MQENLDDACSLVGEQALELTDVVRPALPDRFGDQAVYPYRDGLLVVSAVEDADLAPGRTERMHAPQVVMSKLGRRRLLEGDDPAALRVHPRQDMTDRPVLPRRIEPLQHEQQRSPRLGPEPVVQRAEPCNQLVQPLESGLLVRKPEPIARIALGQS